MERESPKSFRSEVSAGIFDRPGVRQKLIAAVLAKNPADFKSVLAAHAPELAGQARMYDVLTMSSTGMVSNMVDENGVPAGPGTLLRAGVPIELLNVRFEPSTVVVTVGDDSWSLPREIWDRLFPRRKPGGPPSSA